MKKITIAVLALLMVCSLYAQQSVDFKGSYDSILEPHYTGEAYHYNNAANNWWESWGWILLSYVRMYEATRDTAYLNKFVRHSYGIQTKRGDYIWDVPMHSSHPTIVLYTGLLLRPMAEMVYLIKNESALSETTLLSELIRVIPSNPHQVIANYGDYANWLQARVVQSMDYMLDRYWINDKKCFRKSLHGKTPIEINFNASYASTLFYMGKVDSINHSDYTRKAARIVKFFRKQLTVNKQNQSYTWYHDARHTIKEDVAHGSIDIQIPLIAQKLYGDKLFSPDEMNRFARTFTDNIWDSDKRQFHNNVFGTDNDCSSDQALCGGAIPINGAPNFFGPGEVLTWMPLYLYDDTDASPNDIYTVLVTQAEKLLKDDLSAILPANYCNTGNTHLLSGAQSFYGLAEVIKAKMEMERSLGVKH